MMTVPVYEALLDSNVLGSSKDKNVKFALACLTKALIDYLIGKDLWFDTSIYANGVCFTSIKPTELPIVDYFCKEETINNITGKIYCYDDDVKKYTQYSNGIVTMIFEGPLYHIFNYYMDSSYCNEIIDGFNKILQKYGLYYEMGNAWNLGLYEISEGSFLNTRIVNAYSGWREAYERLFNEVNAPSTLPVRQLTYDDSRIQRGSFLFP